MDVRKSSGSSFYEAGIFCVRQLGIMVMWWRIFYPDVCQGWSRAKYRYGPLVFLILACLVRFLHEIGDVMAHREMILRMKISRT